MHINGSCSDSGKNRNVMQPNNTTPQMASASNVSSQFQNQVPADTAMVSNTVPAVQNTAVSFENVQQMLLQLLSFVQTLFMTLAAKSRQTQQQSQPQQQQQQTPANPFQNTPSSTSTPKQIVVLDDLQAGHGQLVTNVLTQTLNNRGVNNSIPVAFAQQNKAPTPYSTLQATVDASLSKALSRRASEIDQLSASGNVGVINISNGLSPVDMILQFSQLAEENPTIRQDMLTQLNLPATATKQQIQSALANYIQQRQQDSPEYKAALAQYQQSTATAKHRGTSIVVAAGNSQDELKALQASGVTVDNNAGLNLLTQSSSVLTVGAIDDKGTPDQSDDTGTDFSSQGQNVDLLASGVNVFGNAKLTGTSFAAPQVAALIAQIQQQRPDLSASEVEAIVSQTASRNTNLANAQVGNLQWQAALAQASILSAA